MPYLTNISGTATCGQEARDSPPTATRAVLAPSMDTGLDSANLLAIAKPVSNKGARAALDGGTGDPPASLISYRCYLHYYPFTASEVYGCIYDF